MAKFKTVIFSGKTYKYKSPTNLARKLKLSLRDAKTIIRNQNNNFIVSRPDGAVVKYNLKDRPVIFHELGIAPTPKQIIKAIVQDKNLDGWELTKGFPDDLIVNFRVSFVVGLYISSDYRTLPFTFWISTTADNLLIEIINRLTQGVSNLSIANERDTMTIVATNILQDRTVETGGVGLLAYSIVNVQTQTPFSFSNGKLRDIPIDLRNVFGDDLEPPIDVKDNCVRDYLRSIHKRSKKKINNLGNKEGVSIEELEDYVNSTGCGCHIVDINNTSVLRISATNSKRFKKIRGVGYNNHFYPLKRMTRNRKKNSKYEKIEYVDNVYESLKNITDTAAIKSSTIKIKNGEVNRFIHNNTLYINNPDFQVCSDILTKLGLPDRIDPTVTLHNIANIIEDHYLTISVDSFLPHNTPKTASLYRNDKLIENNDPNEFVTIDENMQYMHKLMNLPHLIKTDFRQYDIHTIVNNIVPYYLYIAEPIAPSQLMPDNNLYSGSHLINCRGIGLEFIIHEELECSRVENYYKTMIKDLIKACGHKLTNKIMRMYIGKFECRQIYNIETVDRICNDDEAKRVNGAQIKLGDNKNMILKNVDYFRTYNRKPIAIQIKDASRWSVYQKMVDLGLKRDEIVQIKVDSITILKKGFQLKKQPYTPGNWKTEETFKPISGCIVYPNRNCTLLKRPNENIMNAKLAGNGKTYDILNHRIKECEKENKTYIVLTPSYSTLTEYRKEGVNAAVIQTYTLRNTIPKEEVIIVDECGLMGTKANDLIYKCYLLNKRIYCYGDYNQQLPYGVERPFNATQYLYYVFNMVDTTFINRRNSFTEEYYIKLTNYIDYPEMDIIKEVHKYDTEDPEFYIAFRNKTVDDCNKKIMAKKGFNNIYDEGMKVKCVDNKMAEYGIYNQFIMMVTEYKNKTVTLDNEYKIPVDTFLKYFEAGFCINTFAAQGRTLRSYKYCEEDDDFLKCKGVAYTVISRIKD